VSLEYCERLRRLHDENDVDTGARNESRHIRSLLMKKNAHPYDWWVKMPEVQGPLYRRARKRRPITLPIYETEATGSRHVDTAI
jgi:hypothetical protein